MRTLDLVDERTSTPPVEAAVPDTDTNTDTDTSVVTTSGEESTATTPPLPSSGGSTVTEPPLSVDDGGVSSPDAAPPNMCPKERPYYDPVTSGCMECWFDRDCPPEEVCVYGGNCEPACRSNSQCPFEFHCNQGRCVECRSDFDCGMLYGDSKPVCDHFWGRCREECTSNFQCTLEEPVCDAFSFSCRGCVADNECPSEAPVCTPFGRCTPPVQDGSMSESSTTSAPSSGPPGYGFPSESIPSSDISMTSGTTSDE